MKNCIFCKICEGDIPAHIHYQDEHFIAFADINPQAPVHRIIIPRQHIDTLNDLKPNELPLLGQMVDIARRLAVEEQLADNGYRLVMNCNAAGGQTVFHIHLHLLGGRMMTWPPG